MTEPTVVPPYRLRPPALDPAVANYLERCRDGWSPADAGREYEREATLILAASRPAGTSGDPLADAREEILDDLAKPLDALERVLLANVPDGQGRRRALALVAQMRAVVEWDLEPGERERLTEEHDRRLDR